MITSDQIKSFMSASDMTDVQLKSIEQFVNSFENMTIREAFQCVRFVKSNLEAFVSESKCSTGPLIKDAGVTLGANSGSLII